VYRAAIANGVSAYRSRMHGRGGMETLAVPGEGQCALVTA